MSIKKRDPVTHELKCWTTFYDLVDLGIKSFEIRKRDRPYQIGDTILLRRYDPISRDYTGQQMWRGITYLLDLADLPGEDGEHFAGYVAIGLDQPEPRRLTLEALREMNDGYVWIHDWSLDLPYKAWADKRGDKVTALVFNEVSGYGLVVKDLSVSYNRKLYGKEWACYDRLQGV